MGTIHLAVAGGLADFRKLLVVKELRQDLSANPRFIEMFLDEAKLAARLNHPNVVQTIEAGHEDGRYFLSMEFLDGQPYSSIWSAAEKFPAISLPIQLRILCDALAGLHYAHTLTEYDGTKLQIVHRDVSPQNIFVTYEGQVKVVDFGIAKAAVSSTLTSPGMFKGKFAYAAPEQVRGDAVDARTDVFAMGVILWETLSRKRFCDGLVIRESVTKRLSGDEPRAAHLPKLDPRLAAICDRALAVQPEARFGSAEEFRVALDRYLAQSGQRVEQSTMQEVLAKRFAAERRSVHRLIDQHIKLGVVEESHVGLVALGSESGNNQPTQVADLSKYVQNTNETVVSGVVTDLARETKLPKTRRLVVAGIATVSALGLAIGALVALHGDPATQPTAAAKPALSEPAAEALAPASRAPVAVAAPTPQPARVTLEPHAASGAVEAGDLEQPEPQGAQPSAQQPSAAWSRAAVRKGARQRPGAVAQAGRALDQPAPASEAAPAIAPAPAAPVTVGADLNRIGRSDQQQRDIDTEF
jgi:serine/threonine protein kinase